MGKDNCDTAIKILMQYERILTRKKNHKPEPHEVKEWNRKRKAGIITIYDLPGTLHGKFPGEFKGWTLKEIRDYCK